MEVSSGLYRQNLMEFLKEEGLWPTEVSQEIGGTFPPNTWFLRKGHLCRVCVGRRAGFALKTVMGDPPRTILLLLLRLSLRHLWLHLNTGASEDAGAGQLRGQSR